MSPADYERLREDIRANGLLRPIVEHEGMILDGNHRWRACAELNIEPAIERFAGTDPAHFVYSINIAHRHLTKGQIAIAAAKLMDHYAAEAKKRQGARTDIKVNSSECSGQARDAAGRAFGVSGSTVDHAAAILKTGAPELIAKVERGEVSINQAQQIARYPKSRQAELVAIDSKRERTRALQKSATMSIAKKRPPIKNPATDGVPGTRLVKNMLARLEHIAADIERSGMTPDLFAQTFLQEFDWQEPLLVRRLSYAESAIRCISTMQVASQRAKKTAA